jgi:hypothetical protein
MQGARTSAAEVVLLHKLGQGDLAVERAMGSGDTELVTDLILRMIRDLTLAMSSHNSAASTGKIGGGTAAALRTQLYNMLQRYPHPAQDVFFRATEHCALAELNADDAGAAKQIRADDLRRGFCEHFSADLALAHSLLRSSWLENKRVEEWVVSEVTALFANGGDEFSSKAWTSHGVLLADQAALSDKHNDDSVMHVSPIAAYKWCLRRGDEAEAEKLRAKFGISDRAMLYAKIDAWSANGRWDALDPLFGIARGAHAGRGTAAPIATQGVYQKFIETARDNGQHDRAVAVVPKLASLAERVEWFVALDEFQRAADDAADKGDGDMLRQIRRRSQNPQMQAYIERKIAEL